MRFAIIYIDILPTFLFSRFYIIFSIPSLIHITKYYKFLSHKYRYLNDLISLSAKNKNILYHVDSKKYSYFRRMNKLLSCIPAPIVIFYFGFLSVFHPGTIHAISHDSLTHSQNKKGWNITPLPEIAYNSDLGFQYGIYCELYNFGNGSNYPNYTHKLCTEVAQFTKGSGVYWFFYDSPQLWKNHRLSFDIAYLPDKMCDFYGYNGLPAPYSKSQNNSFYKIDRKQIRAIFGLQGKIAGNLNWMAGISWQKMMIGPVTDKKYADAENLYNLYIDAGLIHKNEAKGGNVLQWKAGIVYDTRDREADPTRGMYGEAIVAFSPDWIDRNGYSFIRTTLCISYYQPLWREYLTLAGRIGSQFTPFGKVPFYFLSDINTYYIRQTYSEGLGGISSLRGILRNRIVGNGIGWTNIELRLRSKVIRLLKQNWYIGMNPFIDAGTVLQSYRSKLQKESNNPIIYSGKNEKVHVSAGIGLKLVMNHNFVLSAEWGKAFNREDGSSSIDLGVNYLF